MNFDIHSHLIPKIDDGAKSIDESIKMLQILKGEGVDNILATPHFYPDSDNLEEFLAKRAAGLESVASAAKGGDIPAVFPACELYYTRSMADYESLTKLCIANTNYILIELPYGGVSKQVLKDIYNFSSNYNMTPILAHLERFGLFKGFKDAVDFVASGYALAQVNVSSFFDKRQRKYAEGLARKDLISFLGSDLHSPKSEPMFRKGLTHLEKFYPKTIKRIESANEALYSAILNANPGK